MPSRSAETPGYPFLPTPELRVSSYPPATQRLLSAAVYLGFRALRIQKPLFRGLNDVSGGEVAHWAVSHRNAADIPLSHLAIRKSGAQDRVIPPTKDEYWYQRAELGPFRVNIGRVLEYGGSQPLSRGGNKQTNRRLMDILISAAEEGVGSLWYPEGHRYPIKDHQIHQLGKAVLRLSDSTRIGIRPMGIAYRASDDNRRLAPAISIGELIEPPTHDDSLKDHADALRAAMQQAYNEALEMLEIEPTDSAGR